MRETISDIILVDKVKGITSFDVIRRLRKKLGVKKMGYAGTLDPLASGLMIVGVEKGTKKLSELLKLPKIYEVEVILGKKTSTADMEGDIIQQRAVVNFDIEKVKNVLKGIVGKIRLPVPAYSAVKVSGMPLYKLARKGKKVEPPIKIMEIFWLKLKGYYKVGEFPVLQIELEVKSGTYIRSIAEEIGKRLGYPAVVKDLRRTRIGEFRVEDALQI